MYGEHVLHTKRLKLLKSFQGLIRSSILALIAGLLICANHAAAQGNEPPVPRQHWSAQWISHPTAPLREPITLHFKKTFDVKTAPAHFVIHVSADNRFVLYLNGRSEERRVGKECLE